MRVWNSFKEIESNELQRLAASLPIPVLQCKATSTTRNYLGAFRRWKVWATTHSISAFPVNSAHIALYLQHLAEVKSFKAAIEKTVNGLAWSPFPYRCTHCLSNSRRA